MRADDQVRTDDHATNKLSAEFVSGEFVVAVVLHPQRLNQSPLWKKVLKTCGFDAAAVNRKAARLLTSDFENCEQVVILLDLRSVEALPELLRFANAIEDPTLDGFHTYDYEKLKQFKPAMVLRRPATMPQFPGEPAEYDGTWKSIAGHRYLLHSDSIAEARVGPRTLLAGPEPRVRSMLEAKATHLRKLMRNIRASHEGAVIIDVKSNRAELLEQEGNGPFSKQPRELITMIDAIVVTVELDTDPHICVTFKVASQEFAQKLYLQLKSGLQNVKRRFAIKGPDRLTAKRIGPLYPLMKKLSEQSQISREGSTITLRSKIRRRLR